ncbi:unnamed protein product, partial [Polarella glacialis]
EQTLEASQLRLEEEAQRLSAQASVAELQAQTLSSELGRATSASEELAAALRRDLESSAAAGLAEEVLEAEENVAASEAALEAWRRRSSGEAADAGCAAEACVQALRARLTSAARSELSCFATRCREEELAAQHSSAQRAEVAETEAELRLAALRHHGKEALSAARLRSSEDCAARKRLCGGSLAGPGLGGGRQAPERGAAASARVRDCSSGQALPPQSRGHGPPAPAV